MTPSPASAAHDPRAQLEAESWWRRMPLSREMEIPADDARGIWTSIRPFPVLAAQEQAAIDRLATRPWSRLEDEDVLTLLGHTLPADVGPGVFVLLRGVVPTSDGDADFEPDRFLIHWKDGTVLVKSLVARTADRPLRRTAFVAGLPGDPGEVYVDALTAIHDL